ncbi:Protein phosphatase PTC7 homolog [Coccomyxa sp. Obi]|nr:Protein phosphatase PTC7 homolog [Coccomyxa sp. Obi]
MAMHAGPGAFLHWQSHTLVPFISGRTRYAKKIRLDQLQKQQQLHRPTRPRHSGNRSVAGAYAAASSDVVEAVDVDKDIPAPATQLRLEIGAKVIPHPDKASYGGEDAFFMSNSGGGAMGVADGVGGWQESGINPAEYSRTFMRIACHYLEGKDIHPVTPGEVSSGSAPLDASASDASSTTGEDSEEVRSVGSDRVAEILTARGALAAAHAGTRLPGSSTACILRLNRPNRTIDAANLGDSGFMLVRDGEVVFKSPVLQHFFDCPLQFGACPDFSESTDSAEDAAVFELAVQPGDVLLAGSDGLWDNCYDHELLQLLPDSPEAVEQAAGAIAGLASQHAADKKFRSPYTEEAKRQGYDLPWWEKVLTASFDDGEFQLGTLRGGKIDDITVLVAVVVEEDVPTPVVEQTPDDSEAKSEAVPSQESL